MITPPCASPAPTGAGAHGAHMMPGITCTGILLLFL